MTHHTTPRHATPHHTTPLEVEALRCTGALLPYDTQLHGLPQVIAPLMVSCDSSGKFRLIYDARYLNSFLQWLPV